MQPWFMALALLLSPAPAALAGGIHAAIESPDGLHYTARTYECGPNDALEPWALAEGVVDGKGRSVLITLTPTSEHGVYTFTRTWPKEGHWMIRYNLGHPPAPATVATLRADGRVQSNRLYSRSDGSQECWRVLRKRLKHPEDC